MTMYRLTTITKDTAAIPEIKDVLETNGAKILSQTEHGERRFTYTIQKLDRGNYVSFVLETNPSEIGLVEKTTREVEGVLRTLLVEWSPTKAIKPKTRKTESETVEVEVTEPTKPAQEEIKKTPSKDKKPVKGKKAKKSTESDADRLKELDEKLAEILKS